MRLISKIEVHMYLKKIFIQIFFCVFINSVVFSQIVDKNNTNKIVSYKTEKVKVLETRKADDVILFFEDTTRWGTIGVYCSSDISFVEDKGLPNLVQDLKGLSEVVPLVLFNGNRINLSGSDLDFRNLLPYSVRSFCFGTSRYVMIDFNFVSFIGTQGWSYILLRISESGNVIGNYYFESQEQLEETDLADFNGDNKLDFLCRVKYPDKNGKYIYSESIKNIEN